MDADELVALLRVKAREVEDLPEPASERDVRRAEMQLGFALHPLHARLLLEVADGGFGPGLMYGVGSHGRLNDERGLAEIHRGLAGEGGDHLPGGMAPFADLGCGCWLLVQAETGRVLAVDEFGVVETAYDLGKWLEDWLAGVDVASTLFDRARAPRHEGRNPFNGAALEIVGRGPLLGRRLSAWPPPSGLAD